MRGCIAALLRAVTPLWEPASWDVSSIGGGFDGRAGCVGDDAQRFGRFVRALYVAMKHVDVGPPGGILHLRSMLSESEPPSCASSFVQRHAPPAGDMESLKQTRTS